MNLKQFLDWVVPSGHVYSAAKLPTQDGKGTYIHHRNFDEHAKLARHLTYLSSRHCRDTWFAVASFREGLVLGQDGKSRPSRKQNNVLAMRSLYIDMDVKEGGYISKHEAVGSLSAAVDAGSLPMPSIIVDSGNGIHAYWCFNENVGLDKWTPVAHGFRDAVLLAGLKIDPGITIDSARILRPPETSNWKDPANPKPVRVLGAYWPHTFESFTHYAAMAQPSLGGYQSVLDASGLPSVFATATDGELGDGGFTAARAEYQMQHIVAECEQMKTMLACGGAEIPEPAWKAMLLVAARCEDGVEYAHKLSEKHKTYSQRETDDKLLEQRVKLQAGTTGPSACATFDRERPGVCMFCPHKGRIKSPIVLGRGANEIPVGFLQKTTGVYTMVHDPESDETTEVLVCNEIISDIYVMSDEEEGTIIGGNWTRGMNRGRFHFPIHRLSVPPSRAHGVVNQSGMILRTQQVKHFQNLMFSWTEQLITRREATAPAIAIGWTDDKTGFNYLDEQIMRAGAKKIPFIAKGLRENYSVKGSRKAWDTAVQHMLQAPIELQAIIALSFAAPLAAFSALDGFLFSFRSAGSGVGKSTAMRMAASMWGDPMTTVFSMSDTPKYILRKLGMTPHLPAFWDEVRIINEAKDFQNLTKLIFELAQGQEMRRLKSDTSFQHAGNWRTLFAVATNESLLDLATGSVATPEPVLARLLEVEVPPSVKANTVGGQAIRDLINNYGFVGREYIRTLLPLAPNVKMALEHLTQRYQSLVTDAGGYRYWATASALMMLGAKLAKSGGFYAFDLMALEQMLIRTMTDQVDVREEQVGIKSDDEAALRAWMLENQARWMVTQTVPGRGRPTNIEPLSHPDQRLGGMLFHISLDQGIARLKMTHYLQWCHETRRAPFVLMRGLERISRRGRMSLGGGTSYSEAGVWCLEINLQALGMMEAVEKHLEHKAGSLFR